MQAHALTALLTEPNPPEFPFLTLLISGGHTMIVLAKSVTQFSILATTIDDAIGEAFDKAARDLDIPWTSAPGAALESLAASHLPGPTASTPISLPIPCKGQPEFSFSGLKYAVKRHIEVLGSSISSEQKSAIAHYFQLAACAQLEDKLGMVLRSPDQSSRDAKGRLWPRIDLPEGVRPDQITTVICSGGVASNHFLRKRLWSCLDQIARPDVSLKFPPLSLCTDNAAMIAWVGHLTFDQRTTDYTRHIRPKWSIDDLHHALSP
jgi:N6-L-threonylcarbamoyladenine synthase